MNVGTEMFLEVCERQKLMVQTECHLAECSRTLRLRPETSDGRLLTDGMVGRTAAMISCASSEASNGAKGDDLDDEYFGFTEPTDATLLMTVVCHRLFCTTLPNLSWKHLIFCRNPEKTLMFFAVILQLSSCFVRFSAVLPSSARYLLLLRRFSVAVHSVWNSLPAVIHACSSSHIFRHLLKTHCFNQALSPP